MTKNCNYSLVNIHWSNISDNARDLIHKTLTFKENRITASEIAKHPWLQNMDELKQYMGRNKKIKNIWLSLYNFIGLKFSDQSWFIYTLFSYTQILSLFSLMML